MPSLLKQHGLRASRAISSVLGESSTYKRRSDGETYPNLMIKITKGKELKDEFGSVYDIRTEASIMKEDLPFEPDQYDSIVTDDGEKFTIDKIIGESNNKWYCAINIAVANG